MNDLTPVSRRKLVARGITLYVFKNTYFQAAKRSERIALLEKNRFLERCTRDHT